MPVGDRPTDTEVGFRCVRSSFGLRRPRVAANPDAPSATGRRSCRCWIFDTLRNVSNIFVSHAAADKALVDPFVSTVLQLGCEVPKASIFFSSRRSTGVPSGTDLSSYVRGKVQKADLVVAIISPTFQSRPYCAAELGAAWGVTNKLFPILTPGMRRTDLDGVLPTLLTQYLDESEALDELHERVCNAVGSSPGAMTWNEHKASWLVNVKRYAAMIPTLRIITPEDYDRAIADAKGAQLALGTAQDEITRLEQLNERLAEVKDREAVQELLMDDDENREFERLRDIASVALERLPHYVQEAVFLQRTEGFVPNARPFEDERRDALNDARLHGHLMEMSDDALMLNEDSIDVEEAVKATDDLSDFLGGTSNEFKSWFRTQFRMSPDLSKRSVWEKLF